jgi:hypothetical protein
MGYGSSMINDGRSYDNNIKSGLSFPLSPITNNL